MWERRCLVACLVGLWAANVVSAGLVVNVDFNSNRGQGEYTGPGAYPGDAGTFWNQSEPETNPTLTDLVASDGKTETTIGVAITSASGNWGNTIIASALLSDYVYTDNSTANIILSGLTPNGSYTLYLYSVGDQPGQGAAFTFGDVTSECAGGALLEDFQMADGRVLTSRLSTYLIPTVVDVPDEFEAHIVEVPDPRGPFGARGMGEMPYLPAAAVVCNAFDKKNNYPLSNLYVSMLQRLGIETREFSTGKGTMRGLEMA